MKNFEYFEPKTIEEASGLLIEHGDKAKLLAGGTDLLPILKEGEVTAQYIISLEKIANLSGISYDDEGGLLIGALTKIRDIEKSDIIREKYVALSEAAGVIGSVQIRNLGTIGGNICHASPAADTAPALLVYGAMVKIAGKNGGRTIPIEDFHIGPGKTALEKGEIVTSFILPPQKSHCGANYIKLAIRRLMDLAFVGVAASVTMDNGMISDVKIGLGAVAPKPIRATNAEEILRGKAFDKDTLEKAGDAASQQASPISDLRASADYRRRMVKVLTMRALQKAIERTNSGLFFKFA
jgi:carbon-monoxide dehydrogenase medium subunit